MNISKDMIVGDVLEKYLQLLDIFVRKGFTPLRDPVMRQMMAKTVTIEQVCQRHGVNLQELLEELNKELEKKVNKIAKDTIVNDALKMTPQTLKGFTKYGIDACCGSYVSIKEGAKRAKANLETLLTELNRC